jgi:hypothetical protein
MFVSQIFDEASAILATTDQKLVFRKLSQAVQTLMESGHYFHTQQEVDVCTGWDGQTITLPRGIEVPLGVNIDGSPMYFRGRLFQYHINKGGMYNSVSWAWDDRGFVSTIMDIRQPSQLVAVAEHSADAGGQIRVIGTDGNNRELRTQYPDGTSVDGILVPIHAQSDFPYGTIEPDGVTIQSRSVAVTPISQFLSATAHQLSSGQGAILSLNSGTMPSILVAGNTYFVGVDDDLTIKLYQTSLDAKAGTNFITLQSIIGAGQVKLTDSRVTNLLTAVNLQSVPPITIDSPNSLTFLVGGATATATISAGAVTAVTLVYGGTGYLTAPTITFVGGGGTNASVTAIVANGAVTGFTGLSGGSGYATAPSVVFSAPTGALPSPLVAGSTYFAQTLDATNLEVYGSLSDAQSRTNPISLTGNSGKFNVDLRKEIAPQTTITFTFKHYYTTGDEVEVYTSGGSLPSPLLAGQKYYVHVISDLEVSVHLTPADALASTASLLVNPILFTDEGFGTNSMVKLIPATTTTGTASQLTAVGLQIPAPTQTTIASANVTVTGSVTNVRITSAGSQYTSAPTVTFSAPPAPPAGTSQLATRATGYAVMIPDAPSSTTFAVGSIVITSSGSGYTSPPTITIDPPTTTITFTYAILTVGTNVLTSVTGIAAPEALAVGQPLFGSGIPNDALVVSWVGGATPTSITFSSATGATATAPAGTNGIALQNTTTRQAQAVAVLQTSLVSFVTIPSGAGGSGYGFAPIVKFVGGGGTGATGVANINAGVVTSVRIITQGTGYTTAPSITFTASTGVFVEFTSTGTLPSPLVSGTAYRLEAPLNTSTGTYTIMGADYSEVNITSGATGSFFVALARTFSGITTNGYWSGDFAGIVSGQGVYISSDYIVPTGINIATQYFIRRINSTTAQLFNSQANAIAVPSTTGLINVTSIGVGQKYFAVRTDAYAKAFNNLLTPESTQYLFNDMLVRFSSTGTLPFPLVANTDYKVVISGRNISLKDIANNPIVFVNAGIPSIGVGQLSLDIVRLFAPVPVTTIDAVNSLFEAGEQVTARPNTDDALPQGLVQSTMSVPQYYYARPNGRDKVELYNTQQNAINTASVTGRISFYNTGDTLESVFFVDSILPPTLVKAIMHIEKPVTEGYVSLYAYDYGRSNDMALVGQYHPSEVNPKYRRIRIGQQCAWARIIYRVKAPNITSVYDYIPLENERAIIAAVHACDLEDKDFQPQAERYWATAITYLKNQNESMEGHAMQAPQINGIVYGDMTDPVMF